MVLLDTVVELLVRMRAMILFLLDTGVRSSELVSIELCDVLFEEGRGFCQNSRLSRHGGKLTQKLGPG